MAYGFPKIDSARIIYLKSQNLNNAQIAKRLNVSPSTISYFFRKLEKRTISSTQKSISSG